MSIYEILCVQLLIIDRSKYYFRLDNIMFITNPVYNKQIDQHLAMAFKKDHKRKSPMTDDYGTSLEEAFENGMEATTAHYQAILFMYKQLHDALIKKHAEELEVARVQGKLELFHELFNMFALSEEKEKIESELVLEGSLHRLVQVE